MKCQPLITNFCLEAPTLKRAQTRQWSGRNQEIDTEEFDICPSLTHRPLSPNVRMSLYFAHGLEQFQWGDTWIRFVPARMGFNRSIDLATQALMNAQLFNLRGDETAKIYARRSYVHALDSLRSMINTRSVEASDEAMLSKHLSRTPVLVQINQTW